MKIMRLVLVAVFWIGMLETLPAATSYVAQAGQTPASPYSSWATAASNIQDAIDVVIAGDTVLVSNGVYQTGGVTNWPAGMVLTNRVAITNAITVRSANNDPTNTIIRGAWNPTTTNGPAAVRCVYMTNGSALIGFTLTNGATLAATTADGWGGGVNCPSINTVISNCMLTGNSAYWAGAGAAYGTLFNCTLSRNSSAYGGGTVYGTLYNCTLISNSAGTSGGGAYDSTLTNCTLTGNSANFSGGGVYGGTLYNCTLVSNSASGGGEGGGGARAGTLYNCTLTGNSADYGGGVYGSTLYNCMLTGNSAYYYGAGGMYVIAMYNCTLVGNSATIGGGGVSYGTLYNCVSWGNNNLDAGDITYNYSCGAGYTNGGSVSGNMTNDPLFITNGSGYGTNHVAGNYRLSANSPCLDAGTNFAWMTDTNDVRSADLDGNPRIRYGTVDMGAYETLLKGTIFIAY